MITVRGEGFDRACMAVSTALSLKGSASLHRKSDRGEQSDMRVTRVQARVLDNDRNIRADDGGVGRIPRDGFGDLEVIEPQMPGSLTVDGEPIRPDGLAVLEIQRDLDRCSGIGGVEDTGGFVRHQLTLLADALPRNIAFRNGPDTMPDHSRSTMTPSDARSGEVQQSMCAGQHQGWGWREPPRQAHTFGVIQAVGEWP